MTQSFSSAGSAAFWRGKRVLITGHTGFKGSWLSLMLARRGATVSGFALAPSTYPSLFRAARLDDDVESIEGDVRDLEAVRCAVAAMRPEIVFHLAAQALVRPSYAQPVETYATNVMGTVHVLETLREVDSVRAAVIVTSDKCYENREWPWGYRENESMGGYDPYSSSKGCAELVTSAYRRSYFGASGAPAVATARAGNVIGGGDWSPDRLIPDIMMAFSGWHPVVIRSPNAIRPWQHVIEPLTGYARLAERLWDGETVYRTGWNFGPADADARSVSWIVERLRVIWGKGASWSIDPGANPHEANLLKLDISKAAAILDWHPTLPLATALEWTAEWYRRFLVDGEDARELTERQLDEFERRTQNAAGQQTVAEAWEVPSPAAQQQVIR